MLIYVTLFLLPVVFLLFGHVECQKELVVFWGSNGAVKFGQEGPLRLYCDRNIYDTIILTTLNSNDRSENKDGEPGLDFSNHCSDNDGVKITGLNTYLQCPAIARDIKHCQSKGIKILLDIGRTKHSDDYVVKLHSEFDAKRFAKQLWDLFLGGEYDVRTFGSVKLDGINLTLKSSEPSYWKIFVNVMRKLMDNPDNEKKYFLTAAPNCQDRTGVLKEALNGATSAFDNLYVDFADSSCAINKHDKFSSSLQNWMSYTKNNGPNIYINVPASSNLPFYSNRETIKRVIQQYSTQISGISLIDATWDDRNVINGTRYSKFIKSILDPPSSTTPKVVTPGRPVNVRPPGQTIVVIGIGSCIGSSNTLIAFLLFTSLLFVWIGN